MLRFFVLALSAAYLLTGCGSPAPVPKPAEAKAEKHDDHDHEHHDDHGHDHDHEDHDHTHEPARGGTLVELGDHVGNIEFVLDSATGKLTAYCSDAHAENPVRLKDATLQVAVVPSPGAPAVEVALAAVASPLTGETVGDTSQFEAVIEALKGLDKFEGTILPLDYRGVAIASTPFSYTHSAIK